MKSFTCLCIIFPLLLLFAACSSQPTQPPASSGQAVAASQPSQLQTNLQTGIADVHAVRDKGMEDYCAIPYQTRLIAHGAAMNAAATGVAVATKGASVPASQIITALPPLIHCPNDPQPP